MVKPLRFILVPVLHQQSGPKDAKAVSRHCNGNRGAHENHPHPLPRFEEIPVDDGQGNQTKKGSDSTACFGDVQLFASKGQEIPLKEHGNSEQFKQSSGPLRGDELKGKCNSVDKQGRDRDHQNQKRPRKEDGAKECPSLN